MDNSALIFGKDNTQKIVNIEVRDGVVELYTLDENNDVVVEERPNKYWLLCNEKVDSSWVRLKGELHYKWGRQFNTRSDFLKERRFLKNKDTYSIYDPKESCMVNKGITFYKGLRPKDIPILSFDIETTGLDPKLPNAQVLLISNTFRKNDQVVKKLFAYDEHGGEGPMIQAWVNWVNEMNPSILTGHNIICYDIPYLLYRAELNKVELNLGRDGSKVDIETNFESTFRIDGSRDLSFHRIKIYARDVIDTMFLSYRYDIATKKYESYGLKSIIKTEGLEKGDRVFYDASQIRFKFKDKTEWEKIKAYCVDDSDDSLALFDLMSPSFFYMTQSIPRSFQALHESATGAQINGMMVRSYLQEAHSIPKSDFSRDFPGAISLGNHGIFKNVKKVDVASLYPSIMIEYAIYDQAKDPKGNFKDLVKTFTELRLEYKKKAKTDKYYDDLQSSFKILINSCYGFLATSGLNFNSVEKAAFVTEKGREILTKCIDWCSNKGYLLVNADTDSISYCRGDMTAFSKEEQQADLAEINSMYPDRISWEDDGTYKTVCVFAAKNYVLEDMNGKVKMKGSALKASLKSPALKQFIKDIINEILEEGNGFKDIYEAYVKEALDIKDIRRWCSKKSISDKILDPKRTNEQKVKDIIEGTEYVEGDKIYTFYLPDGSLCLAENYNGIYDKAKVLDQLFKTTDIFDPVLPVEELFTNYSLGKHFRVLCPEQAQFRKELMSIKRKESMVKKKLKLEQESSNII